MIEPVRLFAVHDRLRRKGAHAADIHRALADSEIEGWIGDGSRVEDTIAVVRRPGGPDDVERFVALLFGCDQLGLVPVSLQRNSSLLHDH